MSALRRDDVGRSRSDDPAEDALLRAWARILREAAEAERAARPVLRVVSGTRRRWPNSPIRTK